MAVTLKSSLPARLASLTSVTATAAAGTLALGTSFIDVQRAAVEVRAVQTGDRTVGCRGVAHFDKRKATGAAGITIGYHIDAIHCAVLLEQSTNRRLGGGKIQIAYEDILHFLLFLSFN